MKTKRGIAILLAGLMALSLCACGSSAKNAGSSAASYMAAPAEAIEEAFYGYDEVYAADAASGLAVSSTTAANAKAVSGTESDIPDENPDKIIYSSDVTVETTAFDETVANVAEMVERYNGWIESSSISGSNYYQTARGNASARYASYTLRIPSASFNDLMNGISELGNVPYSHIYTENVTSQYYDVQARLTAYTAQEQRLLEMMDLAETVEDVITIETHLTEIRYKIESLQSSLNNWDRRVSYSTVYLEVQEVREYTPEETLNPTFGEELVSALKTGLRNVGQFLKDLVIFLAEVLPVLVILIPIAWLVVVLVGKGIRKGRERRAARKEKKAAVEKKGENREETAENKAE